MLFRSCFSLRPYDFIKRGGKLLGVLRSFIGDVTTILSGFSSFLVGTFRNLISFDFSDQKQLFDNTFLTIRIGLTGIQNDVDRAIELLKEPLDLGFDELDIEGGGAPPAAPENVPTSPGGGAGGMQAILDVIGEAEAPGGYETRLGGKQIKGATKMTISEVARIAGDNGDGRNYAVGRYQFTTLRAQAIRAKLNPDKDLFSPENQDKLAMELINRRLEKAGSDTFSQQLELSKEFAAIENPLTGKSYHHGKAGNRASISTKQIQLALRGSEGSEPIVASSTKPVPAPNINSQVDKLSEQPEKEFTEIFMEQFDKAFGTNFAIEGQKMTAQEQQIKLLASIDGGIRNLTNKGSENISSNNPSDPHHGLYRRAVN